MSGTKQKKSQNQRVREVLQSGKSLTQAQARTRGIMSLSSRVNELRQSGVAIDSVPYTNRDGRTVVRYQLS